MLYVAEPPISGRAGPENGAAEPITLLAVVSWGTDRAKGLMLVRTGRVGAVMDRHGIALGCCPESDSRFAEWPMWTVWQVLWGSLWPEATHKDWSLGETFLSLESTAQKSRLREVRVTELKCIVL